jgi:hypothetical protein
MTQKMYKYGKHNCKAYKKPVGKGHEVGITLGGHPVFVGNFIHSKEASAWWTLMNKEFNKFMKKFAAAPHAPLAWKTKFLSNYMYKVYYSYLDREFPKYQRSYTQAFRKDERKHAFFKRSLPASSHFRGASARRSA